MKDDSSYSIIDSAKGHLLRFIRKFCNTNYAALDTISALAKGFLKGHGLVLFVYFFFFLNKVISSFQTSHDGLIEMLWLFGLALLCSFFIFGIIMAFLSLQIITGPKDNLPDKRANKRIQYYAFFAVCIVNALMFYMYIICMESYNS